MKKIKQFLAVAIIGVLAFSAGCSKGNSPYSDRPNKITVTYFNSGYGRGWFDDVAVEYMENYNKDVYVEIKTIVTNTEEGTKVKSGLTSSDIYLLEDNFELDAPLLDLTGLVNGYPLGEDEYTIAQKMNSALYSVYDKGEGKFNALPYANNFYTYFYNQTVIDDALGQGNWVLPRTTAEFFELGDRLAQKNVFLTGGSYKDSNDYFPRAQHTWFVQYAGYEAYINYLAGNYYNPVSGAYEFAESAPLMIEQNRAAHEAMYSAILKLGSKSNTYMHKDSLTMDFMNQEASFYGYGYGVGRIKQAFIVSGPWLENEMAILPQSLGSLGYTPVIKAMKFPIISGLTDKLSFSGTAEQKENKLRELISFIDGDTAVQPEGVTQADIDRVSEARSINSSLSTGSVVIAGSSKNKELAMEFVRFLATDAAQKASMKAVNGINMLPYDNVAAVAPDFETSEFVKSVEKIRKDELLIGAVIKTPFSKLTAFNVSGAVQGDLLYNIFARTSSGSSVQTAAEYYSGVQTYFQGQWNTYVERYLGSK